MYIHCIYTTCVNSAVKQLEEDEEEVSVLYRNTHKPGL